MLKFILDGEPIAQMRHRTSGRKHYNPQSEIKKSIQWRIKHKCQLQGHKQPLEGPISIEMIFYLDYPRKRSRSDLNLFLWGCEKNTSKPDDDNMEKFYKDCLSKIVYVDDKQIISTKLEKHYSLQPRTEILVMEKKSILPEKAKKILEMINPDEFMALLDDLTNVGDSILLDDLRKEAVAERVQYEAACKISEFADKFSPILTKISKKYPGIWKELRAQDDQ